METLRTAHPRDLSVEIIQSGDLYYVTVGPIEPEVYNWFDSLEAAEAQFDQLVEQLDESVQLPPALVWQYDLIEEVVWSYMRNNQVVAHLVPLSAVPADRRALWKLQWG